MAPVDTVRQMFEAYLAGDTATAEALLGEDFTFTSPQDDHIDRQAFLERCFPTAERFAWQTLLAIAPAGEHGVFIMYEYQLKTGERHRNTELTLVRDGRLVETNVFFGGRYDDTSGARGA
jgi:ketosteroid isomerase-like protein